MSEPAPGDHPSAAPHPTSPAPQPGPPGIPPVPANAPPPAGPTAPWYPPPPGYPAPGGYSLPPGFAPPGFAPPGFAPPGFAPPGFAPPPVPPRKGLPTAAVITVVVVGVLLACGLAAVTLPRAMSNALRPDGDRNERASSRCEDPQADPEMCGAPADPAEEPENEPEPPSEAGFETALPMSGLPPRAELATAYVDRYRRLITSAAEPDELRQRVADLHKGGFGADSLIALRGQIYGCEAVPDGGAWGVDIRPGEASVVTAGRTSVRLRMRVVERVPVCVTGARAGTADQTQGTTDLDLTFAAGRSSDGRDVWQLTKLRATVVKPDPLVKAGPGVLGHDAVRADRATLFAPVMF